jgi:hypothetical protein
LNRSNVDLQEQILPNFIIAPITNNSKQSMLADQDFDQKLQLLRKDIETAMEKTMKAGIEDTTSQLAKQQALSIAPSQTLQSLSFDEACQTNKETKSINYRLSKFILVRSYVERCIRSSKELRWPELLSKHL